MTTICENSPEIKHFCANAVLRRYQTFTVSEFLAHEFPAVDFDEQPPPDLLVCEPERGGRLVFILPLETAAFWRDQPGNHRLPPETVVIIAPAGSLSTSDINEILTGASGHMVELATLTPAARVLCERRIEHERTQFVSLGGDRYADN